MPFCSVRFVHSCGHALIAAVEICLILRISALWMGNKIGSVVIISACGPH